MVAVLAVLAATSAAPRLEQIPLRHCTAAELIPILRPVVDGHGTLVGAGAAPAERLLAAAPPSRLALIRDVVIALDMTPRPLRLSIRQGTPEALRVRVPEGFETWIAVRPEPAPDVREAVAGPDGVALTDDWWHEALGDGFYGAVQLVRGGFRLGVRTRTARDGRQRERVSAVVGRLGEWVEIGGLLEDHAVDHLGPRFEPDRSPRLESSVQLTVQTLE